MDSRWTRVESPVGPLYVAFTAQGVHYLRPAVSVGDRPERFFEACRQCFGVAPEPSSDPPVGLVAALDRGEYADVLVDLRGLSGFERDVLGAIRSIPFGETRSYTWVAGEIARPLAVRAVGSALARNPVPVLVPCHRVTRADGSLGGYAFGAAMKQALLADERQRTTTKLKVAALTSGPSVTFMTHSGRKSASRAF